MAKLEKDLKLNPANGELELRVRFRAKRLAPLIADAKTQKAEADKAAKAAPLDEPGTENPSIPFPSPEQDDSEASSRATNDWPDPDAESSGGAQSQQ